MKLDRLIALLSIPVLLTAGGTVPHGMGGWDQGAQDPIPATPALFKYKFIGNYTGAEFDYVTLAAASVDYELPDTRIWYGQAPGNVGQIWFTKDGGPATVGCSDADPATTCMLGKATCEQWGENAGVKYRICEAYRIRIFAEDIYAYSARTGKNPINVWHNVTRHEIGHVLGLDHTGGMMGNEFDHVLSMTVCQQDLLDLYSVDETVEEWTYVDAPLSCQ